MDPSQTSQQDSQRAAEICAAYSTLVQAQADKGQHKSLHCHIEARDVLPGIMANECNEGLTITFVHLGRQIFCLDLAYSAAGWQLRRLGVALQQHLHDMSCQKKTWQGLPKVSIVSRPSRTDGCKSITKSSLDKKSVHCHSKNSKQFPILGCRRFCIQCMQP